MRLDQCEGRWEVWVKSGSGSLFPGYSAPPTPHHTKPKSNSIQASILHNVMGTFVSKSLAEVPEVLWCLKYPDMKKDNESRYSSTQLKPGANQPISLNQIRCNTICEGIKCTGMQSSWVDSKSEDYTDALSQNPLSF